MHRDRGDDVTELRVPKRRDLPAACVQQQRDFLLGELTRPPRALARRRRLVLVLVPATVILAAATGFTTYALTRTPKHLESIGCYDRASLSANTAIVDADGRTPTAICAGVWRHGALGPNPPKRLEACVLSTGAIGVFPSEGSDVCSTLGLAPLPASYAAQAKRFARLRDTVVNRLGTPASGSSKRGPQCVREADAVAFVRRTLDDQGYGDWRVQIAGGTFTAARPCAEPSFDSGSKVVLLLPASR
jgi:hypothetical protein